MSLAKDGRRVVGDVVICFSPGSVFVTLVGLSGGQVWDGMCVKVRVLPLCESNESYFLHVTRLAWRSVRC